MDVGSWATVAVVADVEPSSRGARLRGRVLAESLAARVPGSTILLATCRSDVDQLALQPSPWRELAAIAAAPPDVAVACGDAEVATLLPRLCDPVAVDVRRRMLSALGVLPSTGSVLDDAALEEIEASFPLTPTDLAIVAAAAGRITATDPLVGSLATAEPRAVTAVDAALDDVAAAVIALLPTATARLAAVAAENAALRAQLAAERSEHLAEIQRLLAGLDAANDREQVLRQRIAQTEARYDNLLADRTAAPP